MPPAFQTVKGYPQAKGRSVFNGASYCRACHRPLTSPESRAAGIGPVCNMRNRIGTIRGLWGGITRDPVDPLTQLANIGFGQKDIEKVDLNKFALSLNNLCLCFDDIAMGVPNLSAGGVGESQQAMSIACVTQFKSATDGSDAKKQLVDKAAVICSGINVIKNVAEVLDRTAISDETINHFQSKELRQNLQDSLIVSRLYAHVVKGERERTRNGSPDMFFDGFGADDEAHSQDPNASIYQRGPINFAGGEVEIIEGMAEKNPRAKEIMEALVAHNGGIEDAIVVFTLLDDMNVRGKQVDLAYKAVTGGQSLTPAALEAFSEAVWDTESFSEKVNVAATRSKDVPHKAVSTGAQLGTRDLLPGFSHKDKLPEPTITVDAKVAAGMTM